MNEKKTKKLKDFRIFDQTQAEEPGNRVKPTNEYIEIKKEEIHRTVGDCFRTRVQLWKDRVAVKVNERSITYGYLEKEAVRVGQRIVEEYEDRYALDENEKTRYRRQMMLKGWGTGSQEKLKGTTVLVAGAGGSGSPLLQQLALIGIGTIIVCDHDEVELSNLNRQVLHNETRIGMNKALSAQETLKQINPRVRVIAHPVKITRQNIHEIAQPAEIIFDNVDDLEAKFIISEYAVKRNIPHILSSMIDMNSYAVVLHTPYTPCFHCLYDREILEKIEIIKTYAAGNKKSPNPVAGPPLFLCTGFAVTEAIKILLGYENPAYNKYILFNQRGTRNLAGTDGYRRLIYPFTAHFKQDSREQGKEWDSGWEGTLVEEIRISPDPHCPVCGPNRKSQSYAIETPGPAAPEPKPGGGENHWQAVALLFDHDLEMIVGLFGALFSGKTYVPLDPAYPRERLEYILEHSEARIIVTEPRQYKLAEQLRDRVNKNIKVLDIYRREPGEAAEAAPGDLRIDPRQPAYVLYTSGSTGAPKGVIQGHRNVLHFARVYTNALHLHREDRLTLFSSYNFDAAKMDIFGALLNGATLYPYKIKQEGNLYRLPQWLQKEKITIYHSIPTVYRYFTGLLTGGAVYPHLRFIVLGGEAVYKNDVETYKKYFPDQCIFVNGLGPTESTVTLQYFISKETPLTREAVPVGYPVEETEVLILDEAGRETVVNAVGEIVYQSPYLALGYWKDPGKTDEVFVKNPLTGEGRVYRSGDMGRRLENGEIEYVGRKDFQVKIRGNRVEPGEIESKLDAVPGIKKSIVVPRKLAEGEYDLIAYYQTREEKDPEIEVEILVNGLKESLPDYMIPAGFFRVKEYPVTPTGKIDRKALAGTAEGQAPDQTPYRAPGNPVEKKLAAIWQEVLGENVEIGVQHNFFVLGGHSLKAAILAAKIHKEFQVKIPFAEIFKRPTVRGLSEYLQGAGEEKHTPLQPEEKREYYGLAAPQRRIYILQHLNKENLAYNITKVHVLVEPPPKEKLEQAFIRLIRRHESLRTSFHMEGEKPVQRVHEAVEFKIEYKNLSTDYTDYTEGGAPAAKEGQSKVFGGVQGNLFSKRFPWPPEAIIKNFVRPFELTRAPLMRVGLIALPGGEPGRGSSRAILVVDLHHIISDGISHQILERDYMALYRDEVLPPLRLQYRDYARWQTGEQQRDAIKQQEAYWLKEFAGELPPLNLPYDKPRPAVQTFEGDMEEFKIDAGRTRVLKAVAMEGEATLYMVLAAIYNILLHKLTGREDIIVGTPLANRRHIDLQGIIGMFVNTLAMRNYPQGEKSFPGFLREVKDRTLQAFENQEYSFEDLVEKVVQTRDIGRNPLFDVMLALQNIPGKSGEKQETGITGNQIPGSDRDSNLYKERASAFDMTLMGVETPEGLRMAVQYSTRLFKKETIRRYIDYTRKIIAALEENPGIKLKQIEIISTQEKQELLEKVNATRAGYPREKTLQQIYAEQAAAGPGRIALIYHDRQVTYEELNQEANRQARKLRKKGVTAEKIVGISMERSIEMMVAVMAVLKAGGAYLPIETQTPPGRIGRILRDSQAGLIITNRQENESWGQGKGVEVVQLEGEGASSGESSELEAVNTPRDIAYVIYTSGTTGTPRGVMIAHYSVINLVKSREKRWGITEADRVLQMSPIAFDASVEQIFTTLLCGAGLVSIDRDTILDGQKFVDYVTRQAITHLSAVSSYLKTLDPRIEKFAGLKRVVVGGEECPGWLAERWSAKYEFINEYGPTEAAVTAVEMTVKGHDIAMNRVPIGRPLENTRVYVLDRWGNLVPKGVVGELYIGGDGLARGYLNNPELTAEKFCLRRPGGSSREDLYRHPAPRGLDPRKSFPLNYSPLTTHHSPLYKTGDLARWIPGGNLEFVGRVDRQVKIRGNRVEEGEIESCLMKYPGIREVVVTVKTDETGDKYLCAYWVAMKDITAVEIQEYLAARLPGYMVPAYYIPVERIPLTMNGKIDVGALPAPGAKPGSRYKAPGNEIETRLVEIWSGILGIAKDAIGIEADFFKIGGHSLKAAALAARIRKELKVVVPLIEIFKRPVIEAQAAYIEAGGEAKATRWEADENLELIRKGDPGEVQLYLVHAGSGEIEEYIELSKNLDPGIGCWGIRADRERRYTPQQLTIEALAHEYIKKIKKIQPQGPYYISGWCIGGTIGYEMALQLEQQEQPIGFLGIIDSLAPQEQTGENIPGFTLESDREWLLASLPAEEILEKLTGLTDLHQMWPLVVEYLEEIRFDVERVRKIIPKNIADAIPNFEQQGIRELVFYFNRIRSLGNARDIYIPGGKIMTRIDFFGALDSGIANRDNWNLYTQHPFRYHGVAGDHFSIFKAPHVAGLAEIMNKSLRPPGDTGT